MIDVMIVDDHPVVREGLEVMLASEKGFSIRPSAESAEEALALCRKGGAPDVLVSDIHMTGMTGLELLPRVPKSAKRGAIAAAIRHVVSEPDAFVEEQFAPPPSPLSEREGEILRYMALGKTREEISIILGIGLETVKTHSKNLIAKLDATNTAGAVSRAYELGLLRA